MQLEDQQCALRADEAIESTQPLTMPTNWEPKLAIELRQNLYTIKTADSLAEFHQVMDLRREVFLEEFASMPPGQKLHDYESFDQEADFLIIKERDEIIATYRLICSKFSQKFYSASEFTIDEFIASPGIKLELSRACVKKGKRSSIALHLLWRGIAEYMMRTGARYLFGCSSVKTMDLQTIVRLYSFLRKEEALDSRFDIKPLPDYHIIDTHGLIGQNISAGERIDIRSVPPLFLGYLKAGAKVYGAPALDLKFGCIDFFTVLDFNSLSSSYLRKYIKSQIQ